MIVVNDSMQFKKSGNSPHILKIIKTAQQIFEIFENNSFPCLATNQNECDHPELVYHINRMLQTYSQFKNELIPNNPTDAFKLIYDMLIKTAIIFHDIGKLNCFYQWLRIPYSKQINIHVEKIWSYHTGLSSLIAFIFLSDLKQKLETIIESDGATLLLINNLKKIVLNAIICHHSALYRWDQLNPFKNIKLDKYYVIILKYYLKYLQQVLIPVIDKIEDNFLNEQELDAYQNVPFQLKQFIITFSDYLKNKFCNQLLKMIEILFYKKNEEEIEDGLFYLLERFVETLTNSELKKVNVAPKCDQNSDFFLYIVHISSILTNLDKWEAKTSRSPYIHLRNIKFGISLSSTKIEDDPLELINNYLAKTRKDSNLNSYRDFFSKLILKRAEQAELNKIYAVTAPCGIGKTLAILRLAFILRKKFYDRNAIYPKIIYALPFISICDQMEKIFKKIFHCNSQTDILTVHHYLAELDKSSHSFQFSSSDSSPNDDENIPGNSSGYLKSYEVKNWYSEIILTTNIKLFNTLLTYGKKSLMRFHRLTNSIVIIDEYHSIPKKYHDLISLFLKKFSKLYNCTFILATATTPALFLQKNIVLELTSIPTSSKSLSSPKDIFQDINRYKISYHKGKFTKAKFKAFCKEILEKNPNKSIMIVVNTRKLARNIYKFLNVLQQFYRCQGVQNFTRDVYHLSANLIPFHRKKILEKIEKILSNSPTEKSHKQNLVLVTTQLIEAGIDISFQKIIRDLGPLYSIVQVAGRCNRNLEISDENELPVIDVINMGDSWHGVYDPVDIEVTKQFFKKLQTGNGNIIDVSEREIRTSFPLYSNILNERKNRNQCFEEFCKLDFNSLTTNFKLIEQLPVIPIIVIPSASLLSNQSKPELEYIQQIKELVNAIRNNTISSFPRKLYNCMIGVYSNVLKQIEPLAYSNSTKPASDKIFEHITIGNLECYILDLENPKTNKYYTNTLGFTL